MTTLSTPMAARLNWDPDTRRFDGAALRAAIVSRGWTVRQFAVAAEISPACMYNVLRSRRTSDQTTIAINTTLATRQPLVGTMEMVYGGGVMAMVPSRHHD